MKAHYHRRFNALCAACGWPAAQAKGKAEKATKPSHYKLEWGRAGDWHPDTTLAARNLKDAIVEAEARIRSFNWTWTPWRIMRHGLVMHEATFSRGKAPPSTKPKQLASPHGDWANL